MSFNDPVGNRSLTHYDALIIGSGAGGAAMAWMLTNHGLDVLVLEAGPNWLEGLDDPDPSHLIARYSNDELKFSNRYFLSVDPLAEPRTFRRAVADGDRAYTGEVQNLPKHVGGAAMHADVKCPRFLPQDFALGTHLAGRYAGTNFADWPVTYDQLEPFYGYAERLIGVQGDPTLNPFEPTRSTPYPMPPGAPMYGATVVGTGASSLGYHPYPYPTAVNSRPYDGRPPCNDCGFCSGWACPIHAKGGPAVTSLRKALLSGRCLVLPETRAVRLVKNAAGNAITAVEAIGPDGARQMYSADRYVVAASPIESTRLLLLSDPGGPGIGNSSGYVGRNIMFHMQTVALGMWDERLHGYRGRTVTHGIVDFRGDVTDLTHHPLGGIVELGAGAYPIEEAMYYSQALGNIGLQFKNLMRQSPIRDHLFALTLQAEDAPQMTNRVDLDPAVRDVDGLAVPRVTYDHHAFELTARDFYGPKLLDILQAAGARYCALAPLDEISASAHVMGTLRMGNDPTTSVCDATGRFHDVGNLYAADGSLFPTSSGFNPILTITTLSSFVGANIVSPGAPERALT